jgi:hypothetical protein
MATPPRLIEPDATFFVTVRAIGRSCRFVPNKKVRESIDFALKATVAKFDGEIELHEYQFLSNHYHLLGTDVGGVLPKFMCEFNAQVSRQLNALRGIRGANVEKDYNLCVVDMKTGKRAFEHAVYILTNAASAHLVERSVQWLGPNSYALEYGEEQVIHRPDCGMWSGLAGHAEKAGSRRSKRARYANKIKTPEKITFRLTRPPIYQNLSDAKLRAKIRAEVKRREDALIKQRKEEGRRVLGFKRAASLRYTRLPVRKEEFFKRRPTFSADSPARRAAMAQRYAEFCEAYQEARLAWEEQLAEGRRVPCVVFPRGTWLLRQRDRVRCERRSAPA